MLTGLITETIPLGIAQAAVATLLCLLVVVAAMRGKVYLGREVLGALVRGFLQIVLVGAVLVTFLQSPSWTSGLILAAMILIAAYTAARRAEGIPGAFPASLAGVAAGSVGVIGTMTLAGVIRPDLLSLVPVGSMIIANAMNSAGLALNRFRGEVEAHSGHVETALSLGADPEESVTPYSRAAVYASLIPRIDSMRTLGIVWIPGLMTGMVLAGADPLYAAIYQFVVMGMIFSASGIASLVTLHFIRGRIFTEADQLLLYPGVNQSHL